MWPFNLLRRKKSKGIFRVRNVSQNYLLEDGQEVTFKYNRAQTGPAERVGQFERYSATGKCILVHDYSVRGEPRWFDLDYVQNLQLLEGN